MQRTWSATPTSTRSSVAARWRLSPPKASASPTPMCVKWCRSGWRSTSRRQTCATRCTDWCATAATRLGGAFTSTTTWPLHPRCPPLHGGARRRLLLTVVMRRPHSQHGAPVSPVAVAMDTATRNQSAASTARPVKCLSRGPMAHVAATLGMVTTMTGWVTPAQMQRRRLALGLFIVSPPQ